MNQAKVIAVCRVEGCEQSQWWGGHVSGLCPTHYDEAHTRHEKWSGEGSHAREERETDERLDREAHIADVAALQRRYLWLTHSEHVNDYKRALEQNQFELFRFQSRSMRFEEETLRERLREHDASCHICD